jgi:uncharacterized protein YkwD
MTASLRSLVAAAALASCVLCAARAGLAGDDKVKLTPEEEKILEWTNEARKEKKLKPLKVNPLLTELARKHSANMAKQRKLDHTLDGKGTADRIKESGYPYVAWAENIVTNRDSPEGIKQCFEWWMDSPPHRGNILKPVLTEIGIGMARTGTGQIYFTQVFGTPRKKR